MKDEDIVQLYWDRSEDAIRQTEAKYGRYLMTVSNHILNDREDCRECLNDTYLSAWNTMPKNRPAVLSAYLAKIIREISIDLYRKKKSKKRILSEYSVSLSELNEVIPGDSTPDEEFDKKLLDTAVNTFVKSLSKKERIVFIGRYFYFDSLKEIAAYSDLTEVNVKSILFRTRKKLKVYLRKEGWLL